MTLDESNLHSRATNSMTTYLNEEMINGRQEQNFSLAKLSGNTKEKHELDS